jgi:20S proteasome alpha/beta subunit
MESTKLGAPTLGILASDGIVIAHTSIARKSGLFYSGPKKIAVLAEYAVFQFESRFHIKEDRKATISGRRASLTCNRNMLCGYAGLRADADILLNHARQEAVRHKVTHGGQIPCERLVRRICNLKQGYTQHGNLRPFAVHMIYAGYDPENGFQLFNGEVSGTYHRWKAAAVGRHAGFVRDILEKNYIDSCDLTEACALAVATLLKIDYDTVEISTMSRTAADGITIHHFNAEEIKNQILLAKSYELRS